VVMLPVRLNVPDDCAAATAALQKMLPTSRTITKRPVRDSSSMARASGFGEKRRVRPLITHYPWFNKPFQFGDTFAPVWRRFLLANSRVVKHLFDETRIGLTSSGTQSSRRSAIGAVGFLGL
jgi:hypothetical protein